MASVWYATREDVKDALDFAETARANWRVDRAVETASRNIENNLCNRVFYPTNATRYKDWPNLATARSWRLWLDRDELISLTTLVSGGTTITSAALLEPINTGPPYSRIELSLASAFGFSSGTTFQRAVAITGVFGYQLDEEQAATLVGAIATAGAATCVVSNSARIGIGSLLRVDTERMIVTDRAMVSTGQSLQAPALTASNANTSLNVTTGSAFAVDELLLLDSERMKIVDIAGNVLTVRRAVDGSVLATHNASTIYAPRTLTLSRGALGTTAATHADLAAVQRFKFPGPVVSLTIAEALTELGQTVAGYARVVGSGDNQREARGTGLKDLRDQVYNSYGRQVRMRAI